MAGKNFSLADIIPEVDTFTDTDGKKYDVKATRLFGALDYAKLKRFERQINEAQKIITKTEDESEIEAAVNDQESTVNEFMKMLIGGMDDDRISQIALTDKLAFVVWWQDQQPKRDDSKKAPTGNRQQRKRS